MGALPVGLELLVDATVQKRESATCLRIALFVISSIAAGSTPPPRRPGSCWRTSPVSSGPVRSFATDVADHHGPVAGPCLEQVVEVAAHLVALSGGPIAGAHLIPGISGSSGGRRLRCSVRAT